MDTPAPAPLPEAPVASNPLDDLLRKAGARFLEQVGSERLYMGYDASLAAVIDASAPNLQQRAERVFAAIKVWRKSFNLQPAAKLLRFDVVLVGGGAEERATVERAFGKRLVRGFGIVQVGPMGELLSTTRESWMKEELASSKARRVTHDAGGDETADVRALAARIRETPASATIALLALIALIWGAQRLIPSISLESAYRFGAMESARVKHGEIFRLLSYANLHQMLFHLVLNGLVLWRLGSFFERAFGHHFLLAIYSFSALTGGLAILVFSHLPTVGASGAIYGLVGGIVAVAYFPHGRIPDEFDAHIRKSVKGLVFGVVVTSLLPFLSAAGHGGGIVGGFLLMTILVRLPRATADRVARIVGFALTGLLVLSSIVAITIGRPWDRLATHPWELRSIEGESVYALVEPVREGSAAIPTYTWGNPSDVGFTQQIVVQPAAEARDEKTRQLVAKTLHNDISKAPGAPEGRSLEPRTFSDSKDGPLVEQLIADKALPLVQHSVACQVRERATVCAYAYAIDGQSVAEFNRKALIGH